METIRYQYYQQKEVCEAIMDGKVIAFPTDTVYGLGVRYDDEDALYRLKCAKLRPKSKPIPLMVSSLVQIEEIAYVNEIAKTLISNFMPGAFTIVLRKKENVADFVTNGLDTIAIRMPDDEFVLSIMNQMQKPMLVSSANISDEHPCKTKEEVLDQLDGRIDGVVLGTSKSNTASTIVDVTRENVQILREGAVTEEMINNILEGNL